MESSSLIQCFEYTAKLISQKTPFKLDIKSPNGFVFNMSWNYDRIPKACKDLKKSPSTLEKNMARKQKYLQERNLKENHKNTAKDKTWQNEIRCEKCNLKVNSKKQLKSHELQKHKTNKIFMCEYCKKDHAYKHDCQDHVEAHNLKEHEQHCSQCNLTTSLKKQNYAFEEITKKRHQRPSQY